MNHTLKIDCDFTGTQARLGPVFYAFQLKEARWYYGQTCKR